MIAEVGRSLSALRSYVESADYEGWDPYDGLKSRLFRALPGLRGSTWARLAWIQLFKRSSVNFRRLLLVEPGHNPKALALFVSGYCNLYRATGEPKALELARSLAGRLIERRSRGYAGACWGYDFDWQGRSSLLPAYAPSIVVTSFAGSALFDVYDITEDAQYLEAGKSIAGFVLGDLNQVKDGRGGLAFSYTPYDRSVVYNATLLGSRILSRIWSYTKDAELLEMAQASVEYCCRCQREDGSWAYSSDRHGDWVDSFHTGYNLQCIGEYQRLSGDCSRMRNLECGLSYYVRTFFTPEGIPKYYNNRIYPVDIHAPAQLAVTLCRLGRLREHGDVVERVVRWTLDNMQDARGYFFYQIRPHSVNRIPYMRWAQAWMFLALSSLLAEWHGQ